MAPRPSASRRPARQVNLIQALALLLAFLLMAGLGGLLSAGLVMPAVATTSAVTDTSVRLFDDIPDQLEEVPLSEKSTIVAADGTVLATLYEQNRIVVPLEEISQDMQDAVVAIEDHRFWQHGGVDVQGMARALVNNLASDDVEGASTLTQQYVKNALVQAALTEEDPQVAQELIDQATEAKGVEGYARKLAEAKTAISLEKRVSKEEILERYLNIAQFGHSVYGVEAAAQYYFSVSAKDLNFLAAATIAGITKAPAELDPTRNPEKAQARRNEVLRAMQRYGYITQEEYEYGRDIPITDTLRIGAFKLGCVAANEVANAGYFCDYVTKVIANDPAFGDSAGARYRRLYRGGLTIHTTLDPRLQALADQEVKAGIPVDDSSGVGHAISVVEPGTGKILAMAQNRIYNPALDSGAGETSVNYNTDNAYGSSMGFAPGSTFKVFTLVQWLKDGKSLNESIDGRLRPLNENMFTACGQKGRNSEWKPGNAEGRGGQMTVLDATRNSVNSGYLAMARQLDLCDVMDTATSMGIHQATTGEPFDPFPANVLGSQSVAPLTMAAAFATFAANGTFCEPIAITKVIDTDGNELPVPQADCREVLSPRIATAVNHALSYVWTGTARDMGGGLPGGRPSAGKTGTTSENEYTWFVGYTPQLAAAVWTGYAEGMIPVREMEIAGRYRNRVYGSTISGPTWKRFMTKAHEGLPIVRFGKVEDRLLHGERRAVPNVLGRSVSDAESAIRAAGLTPRVGDPQPSQYREGTVGAMSPSSGARVSPGTVVTIHPSSGPGDGGGNGGPDGPGGPGDRGGPGRGGPPDGVQPPGRGD